MTIEKISNYYKWLSLATLVLSIFGALTFTAETVVEKFGIAFVINLQFHLVFQFLSRMPLAGYQQIEKDSPQIKVLAYKILKYFSIAAMVVSIFGLISFLISVVENHDYEKLFTSMTFVGMFLGGYLSNLKFKELKQLFL